MTADNHSEPLSPSISDTEIFKQKPSERRPRIIEMAASNPQLISDGAKSYFDQAQAFKDIAPIFFATVPISNPSQRNIEATSYFDRQPENSILSPKAKSARTEEKVANLEANSIAIIQEFNQFLKNGTSSGGVDNIKAATPNQIDTTPAEQLTHEYQQREKNIADNISRAIGIAQASIEAGDTRMLVETISSYPDIAYHPDLRQKINDHLTAVATNPDKLNSIQTQSKNELLIPFSPSRLPENTSLIENVDDSQVVETMKNFSDLVYASLGYQIEKSIVDAVNSGKTGGFTSVNKEGFSKLIEQLSKETGNTNTQEALSSVSLPNETSINPIAIPATLAEFAASSDFQKVDPKTQRKIFSILAGSLHTLPTSDQGKIAEIISVVESGNSPLATNLSENLLQRFSQKAETANISSLVESQRASKPKIPEAQPEIISPPQAEIPQPEPQVETISPPEPEPIPEATKTETQQASREQALAFVYQNEILKKIISGEDIPLTGNSEVDTLVQKSRKQFQNHRTLFTPTGKTGFFGTGKAKYSSDQFSTISRRINDLKKESPRQDAADEADRQVEILSYTLLNSYMMSFNATSK